MRLLAAVATLLTLLNTACQSRLASAGGSGMSQQDHLRFLYFDGCPMSPKMRESLIVALGQLGLEPEFEQVDLEALRPGDPLLRYGAPTVLVDGTDLMGEPPSGSAALACRIYADGLPDADEIAYHLRERNLNRDQ